MPKVICFEKHKDQYEDWFERNRFAYESELEAVRQLLPEGGEGLEVGVGTGRFAAPLGIRFGVEPSHEMGDLAMYRGIDVYQSYGENLPFYDKSFSHVLLVTTICFLKDLKATLSEVHRVLQPSGHIIIGFVNRESRLGKKYLQIKDSNVFYRQATFFSIDEVKEQLKLSGFVQFIYSQTIFQDPEKMNKPDPVKSGYDEGSFVVIRGQKKAV
jgi:SAM-dependent methyltransferase